MSAFGGKGDMPNVQFPPKADISTAFGISVALLLVLRSANARREAAIAAAQAGEKTRQESSKQNARMVRDREVANLHLKAAQQEAWQRNVDIAAHNALVRQQRQARVQLLGEVIAGLEQMVAPRSPPEPAEPEVIYLKEYLKEDEWGSPHLADRNFNLKWWPKPRSQWPE
jgi:hypothetical protein